MFTPIVTETSVVKLTVQSMILRIVECEQPAQQSSYTVYKTAVAATVTELSSCVEVEVDVLGSTSLIVLMVIVDVKQYWTTCVRAQELCEGRGGRPGLPAPDSPYGLCRHKATLSDSYQSSGAHLDIHTAPELWYESLSVALCLQRP